MKNKLILHFCFLIIIGIRFPTCALAQNVGIGTSTPNAAALLDLQSTSKGFLVPRMTQAQRNAIVNPPAGLIVYQTDNTPGFHFNNGTGWVQVSTGGPTNFWSQTATDIFSNNAGNVGIGIAAPVHAGLEVNRRIGASNAMFGSDRFGLTISSDNPEIGFNYFFNNGTKTIKAGYGGNIGMSPGNGDIYIGNFNGNQSSSDFGDISGYQQAIIIKQNGNVGINVANPVLKLQVAGNVSLGNSKILSIGSPGYIFGGLRVQHAEGTFPNTTFYDLCLDGNSIQGRSSDIGGNFAEDKIVLNRLGGNVGIGLAVPTEKLHIANGRIKLQGQLSNNVQHGIMLTNMAGTSERAFIGMYDDNFFSLWSNAASWQFFMNLNNGNISLGTLNSTHKLNVNGVIRSTEVIVETGWADYVFNRNYKLRTIPELEKFINGNGHLPNIPSAAEIEKHGLHLGDIQKRMMETIEELALYVIQLKKEIDELKQTKK